MWISLTTRWIQKYKSSQKAKNADGCHEYLRAMKWWPGTPPHTCAQKHTHTANQKGKNEQVLNYHNHVQGEGRPHSSRHSGVNWQCPMLWTKSMKQVKKWTCIKYQVILTPGDVSTHLPIYTRRQPVSWFYDVFWCSVFYDLYLSWHFE